MRPLFLLAALAVLSACGGGSSTPPAPVPAPGPSLAIGAGPDQGIIPPSLLGVNAPWEDLGQGIMSGGELVQDRSFRSFGSAGSPWSALTGPGAVAAQATGGDPSPQGGVAYGGCLRLNGGPNASDLVGTAQLLLGPLRSGTTYTLCCSTYAEGPETPNLVAALGQATPYLTVASATDSTLAGAWKHHRLSLTAGRDVASPLLSLAIQGPGALRLDEVRLCARPDGLADLDATVLARVRSLGIRVLRWPGGTLAEGFDWRASVGPMLVRGETLASGGRLQTPSLGLDEFLQLCQALGAEPVLQVSLHATTAEAADLVQYCNGDADTPMGRMRTAHGHPAAYGVTHFELGNEPVAGQSGAVYAALAAPLADAMAAADAKAQFSGVVEASFQEADWLQAQPLLARWNQEALGLAPRLRMWHGHFYSYFDTDADPAARFRRLMSAGTVLRRTRNRLAAASALPLWITEYHVALQQSGILQPERLVDAASGLAVGETLLEMMQGGFEGACAWNLAEPSGFGLLVHPGAWDLRPAGLAQQLLAPFAGETRVATALSGVGTVVLGPGKGNIPSDASYAQAAALASRQANGHLRLALINRSPDQPLSLALPLSGAAQLTWLRPDDLSANNEGAIQVQLTTESRILSPGAALVLPPHCLVRIDL
ncbi:MAG: hypothetical protein HY014_06360 [Acidobacteria bacterium]|nr:hypothetical protein [Acidobacteriota bacterium]MBI3487772.1 hypothetical protein [Acidobacteriota bacterium]